MKNKEEKVFREYIQDNMGNECATQHKGEHCPEPPKYQIDDDVFLCEQCYFNYIEQKYGNYTVNQIKKLLNINMKTNQDDNDEEYLKTIARIFDSEISAYVDNPHDKAEIVGKDEFLEKIKMELNIEVKNIQNKFDWEKFKEYINTYDPITHGCDNNKTIIKDILYGIGISLDNKYQHGIGYNHFLEYLKDNF